MIMVPSTRPWLLSEHRSPPTWTSIHHPLSNFSNKCRMAMYAIHHQASTTQRTRPSRLSLPRDLAHKVETPMEPHPDGLLVLYRLHAHKRPSMARTPALMAVRMAPTKSNHRRRINTYGKAVRAMRVHHQSCRTKTSTLRQYHNDCKQPRHHLFLPHCRVSHRRLHPRNPTTEV